MKNRMIRLFGCALLLLLSTQLQARNFYGFEVDEGKMLVPIKEIHSGGPAKDGIPAIDNPKFVSANQVKTLGPDNRVLGISYNGVVKAYPINIMDYHEIVNDHFDHQPVVVTYCPLCGSGVAYHSQVKGMDMTFGVSGLLYNSDVLLYDRQTESLWSQLMSKSVAGPLTGNKMKMLVMTNTSWGDWYKEHPDTLVLSRDTGYRRNYDKSPYDGYEDSSGVWFPVKNKDARYHPKERVLGIEIDGKFKAYPFAELSKTEGVVEDSFQGHELKIHYSANSHSARITGQDAAEIPSINSFWFAWFAFHPETEVFVVQPR